jgi:hypothetical protein
MAETTKAGERQERLKAALRENLKRRKSQLRGRTGAGETPPDAASPERQDGASVSNREKD